MKEKHINTTHCSTKRQLSTLYFNYAALKHTVIKTYLAASLPTATQRYTFSLGRRGGKNPGGNHQLQCLRMSPGASKRHQKGQGRTRWGTQGRHRSRCCLLVLSGGEKSHVSHCSVERHATDSCFYLLYCLAYIFFSSSLIKTPRRSLRIEWCRLQPDSKRNKLSN